jgi:DNA-binding PadR family transcriptional regulator
MIGKDLEITPMQALFLLTLHNSSSLSGSEIVRQITTNLGEEWIPSPGATYKLIQTLQEKGLIEETTEEEKRLDKRIRTYSLTQNGKEMVAKVTMRLTKIAGFMATCCPEATEGVIVVKRKIDDSGSDKS